MDHVMTCKLDIEKCGALAARADRVREQIDLIRDHLEEHAICRPSIAPTGRRVSSSEYLNLKADYYLWINS